MNKMPLLEVQVQVQGPGLPGSAASLPAASRLVLGDRRHPFFSRSAIEVACWCKKGVSVYFRPD